MESTSMSLNGSLHLSFPENLWLNWFMDNIFNSDIDKVGAKSVINYLIDLNILEFKGEELLKLSLARQGQSDDEVRDGLLKDLNRLSQTERGFALIYFISDLSINGFPPLQIKEDSFDIKKTDIFGKKPSTEKKKTSNLSNLQIVKKWGNELRPFLEVEQQTIARLKGKNTSQKNAQWLFSYILNKTRKKSPAKKWEQLSRKRHR